MTKLVLGVIMLGIMASFVQAQDIEHLGLWQRRHLPDAPWVHDMALGCNSYFVSPRETGSAQFGEFTIQESWSYEGDKSFLNVYQGDIIVQTIEGYKAFMAPKTGHLVTEENELFIWKFAPYHLHAFIGLLSLFAVLSVLIRFYYWLIPFHLLSALVLFLLSGSQFIPIITLVLYLIVVSKIKPLLSFLPLLLALTGFCGLCTALTGLPPLKVYDRASRADVTLSHNGEILAVGRIQQVPQPDHGHVILWNMQDEREIALVETVVFNQLCFSPDDRYLFAYEKTKSVDVFEIKWP